MANKEKGQKYTLTRQQKEDLEKELRYLKIYTRKTVAEKIRQARLLGNLSNNTAFDAARNEQRTTEARINEIESILLNHEIIDYDIPLETVVVGCRVRVNDLEFNEELLFSIVTTDEANSLKNKLSDQSPLGKVNP